MTRSTPSACAAEAEARRAGQEREAQRALLEAVLRQMPAGVLVADAPSGTVLGSNAQLERILGSPYTTADRSVFDSCPDGARPDGRPDAALDWPVARALRNGEAVVNGAITCIRPDGQRLKLEASAGPVLDASGEIAAAVMTLHDVTDLHRAIRDRDEVLAVVSHDLRNPLNTISLATQMLPSEPIEGTSVRPAQSIRRAVKQANAR